MGCGDLIPPPVVPQQIAADGSVAYMGAIMAPVQEQDKQLVVDLAPTAADQLARMCSAGEPLWAPAMGCGDLIPPPVVPQQIAADGSVAYMGAIMAPVQEQDKQLVVDLAPTAADQLARMCSAGEPLWVRKYLIIAHIRKPSRRSRNGKDLMVFQHPFVAFIQKIVLVEINRSLYSSDDKPEAAPYTSEELMKVTEEQLTASAAAAWNTQEPPPSQQKEAAATSESNDGAISRGSDGAGAAMSEPNRNISEKTETER
uniref:START domain-containing protein n=1 Tax=Oryza meridionalis TaxID=40149 RepID=A0A0E0DVD1_9ORYZ